MATLGFGAQPLGTPPPVALQPVGPETEADRKMREMQAKQAAALAEKRRQEEERLLTALTSNLGYHRGRPVAAIVIFRCCLQWRAFQAERTSLFDRVIGVIGSQIDRRQEDNAALSYWLCNTVTLLHLLNKNIKPANSGAKKGGARGVFDSLFGAARGAGGGPPAHNEASIHGGSVGGFRAVEAKYPALLFKQQLDAFVQKIFPLVRDNVKRAIAPMLANCINTPKPASRGRAHDHTSAQQAMMRSWSDILAVMDATLATAKAAHVPRPLVQALFKQLFAFVNVNLFNQLLLRRECCSFSNGENVRMGLGQCEQWITAAGAEWVGDAWEELRWIRQAVQFLVIGNKQKRTLEEITTDLCPVLSVQQLYRISTMYWDDRYNTETVSPDVLSRMKQQMTGTSSAATHSFLLDDDATLPFSAADVLSAMDPRELAALNTGMPVPKALEGGDYTFLEKELKLVQMA
uniref:Dilute domain-containing protein n=1 Tax=Chlamydomonas euryale TaxID=1486919 RepID=A0A7R9Z6X9_9CHLO